MTNMKPAKASKQLEDTRRKIGDTLRTLRQERRWTQVELAGRLHLSQTRLSHVEHGAASLTAEQLLEALKVFNAPLSRFATREAPDPLQDLQHALARLGARHLRVGEGLLPSERLESVHQVLLETLLTGEPRLLAALAPVLVVNAADLNLSRLATALDAHGRRRRLSWAIENTIEAINAAPTSRAHARERLAARRLETALALANLDAVAGPPAALDLLDPQIRSEKAVAEIRAAASNISRKWGIVTRLQPVDFAEALRAARAGD
jgi:transcriptional regulator with XRE-family HTH domain